MPTPPSLTARVLALGARLLGRAPRPAMPPHHQRAPKILNRIKRDGRGVEIGPSYGPLAPKREGYRVEVIDHLDREGLIAKYRSHRMPEEAIEEVDFIWRGESYAELTGRRNYYDWVIASHLIEHTPDLIGFLNNCAEILNENGVLSLAIPDARQCFDHFRPPSGLGAVIDAHEQRRVRPTAGTVCEHYLNSVAKGGRIAWAEPSRGAFSFVHRPAEAREQLALVRQPDTYVDVHTWCFTPHSFRLLIHDLHLLGLQPLRECVFFPTAGCEFYITLSRSGPGPDMDRLALLNLARAERARP